MKPLGGLFFRGATLTEHDDLAPGAGTVGCIALGRQQLLADLELRLGLPTPTVAHGVRLQQWSRRLAEVANRGSVFYAASYGVDPIGTASTLLAWRDQLVDAGWNGEPVADGGDRLDTFADLEREGGPLPPGVPDRLRRVEQELGATRSAVWEELRLAEPREAWPGRWRRVFQLLEGRATPVREASLSFPPTSTGSDLGRLQASIRGEVVPQGIEGDGSVVIMTGETSWDVAHAVAATLRNSCNEGSVVLRGGDKYPLDAALATQGLASLGLDSDSVWRPALQLLPLAVELAYKPRDPYRVLELATLPVGPFAGWVGSMLARALSSAPGVGGRSWEQAKRDICERLDARLSQATPAQSDSFRDAANSASAERMKAVAEWLEGPSHDPMEGAPRAVLLDIAGRVATWLQQRLAQALACAPDTVRAGVHDSDVLRAGVAQARAFEEALNHDANDQLSLVAARQLMEEVSLSSVSLPLATERAGRCDFVDTPSSLRCARDTVIWWHCVAGTQRSAPSEPWRRKERQALHDAGVALQNPDHVLAAEVTAWRTVILAAQRRLVLVIPKTAQGGRLDAHPIWDELVSRLDAKPAQIAGITLDVEDVLAGTGFARQVAPVSTHALEPLRLPEARSAWRLDPNLLPADLKYSVTALEELVGCPLRWLFKNHAALRSGYAAAIPSGPRLNGQLGHRLVEELHRAGALTDPAKAAAAVHGVLEALVEQEGAVLLRPGMTFELFQVRERLTSGVVALSKLLQRNKLSVSGIEAETSADWRGSRLQGRLDLLLAGQDGDEVVLDLKWGLARYRETLKKGLAIQLALYAAMRQLERGAAKLPAAAYYSLNRGRPLTTNSALFAGVRRFAGPDLSETWSQLQATIVAVETLLNRGEVPVPGAGKRVRLLEAAGVGEAEQPGHLKTEPPCKYCDHASLCGRAWESFQ